MRLFHFHTHDVLDILRGNVPLQLAFTEVLPYMFLCTGFPLDLENLEK